MTKTYGIMSDFHGIDAKIIVPAIKILASESVDALILNGDLIGDRSGMKSQDYLATLLEVAGQSGLETYVQPGSHEIVSEFEEVIQYFTQKYSNLINTFDNPKIEQGDHDLVFLQGSDWRPGEAAEHGYSLEIEHETGFYQNEGDDLRVINMNDLKKHVTNPEKTIVVCHVPRKFDNIENCVDVAHFHQGRVYHKGKDDRWTYTEMGVLPGVVPRESVEAMNPGSRSFGLEDDDEYILEETLKLIEQEDVKRWQIFAERMAGRGNNSLRQLYKELGIKKAVTGHFHESAGRANDLSGNAVEDSAFVDELFYNASCMDDLKAGMLTVDGSKVAYENIDLRKHIE